MPGLLPVESAKEVVSVLRKRAKARFILACWLGVLITAAGLWIAAGPLSRKIKGWQSRRLAAQAEVLMDKGDLARAVTKASDALALRESEPAAWHSVARVLTETGQGPQALAWWQRTATSAPLSVSDHRSYAGAALSANELSLASEQIDWLLGQTATVQPPDFLLASRLAAARGNSTGAVTFAERVLADSRATPAESLNAIELVLIDSPARSTSYSKALDHLVQLARSDSSTSSMKALRLIAAQPRRPRLSDAVPAPGPIFSAGLDRDSLSPQEVASRIEANPAAQPYDRLLASDLRAQTDPARAGEYRASAVEALRNGDDQALTALGGWLYDHGRYEDILSMFPLDRVTRSRPLFLERIDALYALGRFPELADFLGSENSILDPTLQHVFLAVVRSKLGETSASSNEWERAVQTAQTAQEYLFVAQFAEANGATEIADEGYKQAIFKQPNLRLAYMARLHLAETAGETARARDLATHIAALWPDDSGSQMLGTYLRLLLGISAAETRAAEEQATAFLENHPRHLGASMVLALARLKLGEQSAALRAVSAENTVTSVPMAVRAAALAANGWRDQARDEAQKLTSADLLPEERALVAPLLERDK